ncbi:hypothetical protein PROFUN_05173 [Planoprotostelium fungivorum]|uniref:Uncharacterized protein n=1 Tax=Planoprotostelium fungivorum TaxID=1890364 RepID=A0A2P6NRE6_9EUKA|nr:hypothetical protein PROFUN_05173 [Planoprotostelium fungivorum]
MKSPPDLQSGPSKHSHSRVVSSISSKARFFSLSVFLFSFVFVVSVISPSLTSCICGY